MTTPSTADGGLRILIVEDEVLVSMFLSDVLMDLGHTVTGTADTVDAALQLASKHPCDLAFIDLGLAGKGDGIEAAYMLREQHGLPALLMSGASESSVAARAEKARPLGILIKPYTEADVQRVLAAAMAQLPGR
jgi:two-component system, response regulator PdtaR